MVRPRPERWSRAFSTASSTVNVNRKVITDHFIRFSCDRSDTGCRDLGRLCGDEDPDSLGRRALESERRSRPLCVRPEPRVYVSRPRRLLSCRRRSSRARSQAEERAARSETRDQHAHRGGDRPAAARRVRAAAGRELQIAMADSILALMSAGLGVRDIAQIVGRSRSRVQEIAAAHVPRGTEGVRPTGQSASPGRSDVSGEPDGLPPTWEIADGSAMDSDDEVPERHQ